MGTRLSKRWRDLLIALNRRLDLPRDPMVRLALACDDWTAASRQKVGDVARRRHVRPGYLHEARQLVATAPAEAAAEIGRARAAGARIVTLADADYPVGLLDLDLPPPVLYLIGRLPAGPAVAMVGSRRADSYALEAATRFARDLAGAGLTVVSGLARGVDAASHRGALEAEGGFTVAVQACGIDNVYPSRHRRLADEIARRGAVITEFPIGAAPIPRNFPIRNRIIAALSVGTLVVQGARRSGTLITARLTLELGREVWAIPGSIYRQRAVGANELIRDGASIVLEPRDVLEALPLSVRDRIESPGATVRSKPRTPIGLAGEALEILHDQTEMAADQLALELGEPVAATLAALAELELVGLVRRRPGPRFRVVEPP